VIDSAAKLLIQIHQDVSKENEAKISEFDDIFINSCMSIINSSRPQITERSKEDHAAAALKLEKLPGTASEIMVLKALPKAERRIIRATFLLK
jgi:hypothetical protein